MQSSTNPAKSKLVAIVVALSNRPGLTPSEEISLKHLRHYLGKYDKYIVVPDTLDFRLPDFDAKPFSGRYFGSAEAHKQLLFSTEYYEAFADYEFILTYHLDALVFSDELEAWCECGYDFIGPPWVIHDDAPYVGNEEYEGRVGNGGFSLKRVDSFLKVLNSDRYAIDPEEYWNRYHAGSSLASRIYNFPNKLRMRSHRYNNAKWELARWERSEELFIANRAVHYYPEFKIAPFDAALRFGFECVPEYCYELNGNKLPFGCHAWGRYDRKFWEQYML